MIIVEGPDGAGKTTLVRDLLDRFDALRPAPHTELPQEERNKLRERNQKEFIFGALADAVRGDGPVRVHDRIFYSHLVYQPVIDGLSPQLMPRQVKVVKNLIDALAIPTIMCMPPLEVVRANVAASEKLQMSGVGEKINEIYEAYRQVTGAGMNPKVHNMIWYDYTGERTGGSYFELERIYMAVEKYIDEKAERSW